MILLGRRGKPPGWFAATVRGLALSPVGRRPPTRRSRCLRRGNSPGGGRSRPRSLRRYHRCHTSHPTLRQGLPSRRAGRTGRSGRPWSLPAPADQNPSSSRTSSPPRPRPPSSSTPSTCSYPPFPAHLRRARLLPRRRDLESRPFRKGCETGPGGPRAVCAPKSLGGGQDLARRLGWRAGRRRKATVGACWSNGTLTCRA